MSTFVSNCAAQSGTEPKPTKSFHLKVEHGEIFGQECGEGKIPVLLVHDGVVDSRVWDGVWNSLCAKFRVLRYDRRGFGQSPPATTWFVETDDLDAVVRQANASKVILVGSSHGGQLCIDYTLLRPGRVERLVLVGAVVSGFPYSQHFLDRVGRVFGPARGPDIKAGIEAVVNDKYLVAPGNTAAKEQLRKLLTSAPQDLTHDDMILPARPALPRLGEIRVPTLIVTGDADIPDVHAHGGAIEAGIATSHRIVLSGVGHLPYLENPSLFVESLVSFISDLT